MKGDFSRSTFQPEKHHRQVLLQQGRVLLDADFNEQGAQSAHSLRQLTRDLLGPSAGPADNLGFAIGVDGKDITVAQGHYYVDGLLAVNAPPSAADASKRSLYSNQEGFPFPGSVETFDNAKPYFFFLDVWERHVTWLEDDEMREVALGGPDTSVRTEVVWQVRAVNRPGASASAFDSAGDAEAWLSANVRRQRAGSAVDGYRLPLMKAFVDPKDNPDETPCVADPLGGYTGLENQLYQVEIHAAPAGDDQSAAGTLTFKWCRDFVMAAWVDHEDDDLIVSGARDRAHGFSAGQWVEISDKVRELRGLPGVMVRLLKVERDRLTYDPATASDSIPTIHNLVSPTIRRWDHGRVKGQELLGGAVLLKEDVDYSLERGIKIRFPKPASNGTVKTRYATGDYWAFPARTASADIEWPYSLQAVAGPPAKVKVYQPREPDGVEHVYAPLAIGTFRNSGMTTPTSLQRKINVLTSPV